MPASGGRVDAVGVSRHAGGRQTLHEVSLSIEPGDLVALAGGSGAGKTTLLEVLAGLRPPSAGQVRHDGIPLGVRAGSGTSADSGLAAGSGAGVGAHTGTGTGTGTGAGAGMGAGSGMGIGYVPQDDIIHLEMPLRRTLRYAARLRLPGGTSAAEADQVVEETMRALDLADRGDVPVRALSGGQRKRASIAVELLTRPRTFFLDEPTSGLDPSTSAEVMRLLRRLSRRGVTVVLTTHEPASIDRCDRVVFLAPGGYLAFSGSPAQARRYFGVGDLAEVYDRLAAEDTPRVWAQRFAASGAPAEVPPGPPGPPGLPGLPGPPGPTDHMYRSDPGVRNEGREEPDTVEDVAERSGVGDPPRGPRRESQSASSHVPAGSATRPHGLEKGLTLAAGSVARPRDRRPGVAGTRAGAVRQWWLLTRRNADILVRNRLTLAVLLGSPVLVTAMMATLFQPGAFDPRSATDLGPAQTVFWVAFAGFFFGLTYGLLQIVGEVAVFRRERLAGLGVGAYVAAKMTVLFPVLAGVSVVLLGVLRALGRLPAAGWDVYASLFVTVLVEAMSALALGLLASAAVSNAAQAALALPMLCFPQVLFAGAIVPVGDMAAPGRLISFGLANRHAFEAVGRDLDLGRYTAMLPSMGAYGDTFDGAGAGSLLVLAGLAVAFTAATVWVLHRRSRPGTHRR